MTLPSDVNEGINQALSTYHTSRGGNSNGLHVAQGSAPESDRHSAISELDGEQKRNGCVAQMDMPRNDAPPADESSASAAIQALDVADLAAGNAPVKDSPLVGSNSGVSTSARVDAPEVSNSLAVFLGGIDALIQQVEGVLIREPKSAEVGQ